MSAARNAVLITVFAVSTALAAKPPAPPPSPLDPLPLESQVLVDSGIDAAKARDFKKALELFERASSKAPDSAVIFLNRGLAEARMRGREFRAIAFLSAYLAAAPSAANADSVEQAVADLRRRSSATTLTIAKGFLEMAAIDGSTYQMSRARASLCRALIDAGDLGAAEKTLNEIDDAETQAPVRIALAEAKANARDSAGARAQISALQKYGEAGNLWQYLDGFAALAIAQSKAGDLAGATQTLALLATLPPKINDAYQRSDAFYRTARAQFAAGDAAGAKASVTQGLISAQKETGTLKSSRIADGGEIQAAIGDLTGARKTVDSAADFMRPYGLNAIADEQIKA